jgi:hypothetical protein
MFFIPFSIGKRSLLPVQCPLLPSDPLYTHFYFPNSLATVFNEPDLYRLLRFHVPNLISIFRWLGRAKQSVLVRSCCVLCFVTNMEFYGVVVSPRPIPKLEDHPQSAVREYLFNMFASTPISGDRLLYPQPEDAPCRGDSGPFNMVWVQTERLNIIKTRFGFRGLFSVFSWFPSISKSTYYTIK